MNILQVVPKLNIGGAEKCTVEMARYLTLNGHKAVVVSGGGVLEKNLAAMGVRHYAISIGCKNPLIMLYSYWRLKRVIKKENIEIVHARSRVPALIGYFAARTQRKVFITTAEGQYKKHWISRVMGWGKMVIVANETMARHMKENFDVPVQKIAVVPGGVDLNKFSFTLPSKRDKKTFRVGMICRFTPLKGHLDFLKAVSYVSRRMHNLEVIIMGAKSSAKEEYMKKIELTMRRLMLTNIVKLKDSDEDVSEVMKSLNVFVSANKQQEAFGRTVVEAQASGVPVVATKVGGVLENISDGVTGLLCEPVNPSEMAAGIMRYAKEPAFAEEIALNARKYVEKNCSLKQTMKMTVDIYSRMLSAKKILLFKISSLGDIILSTPSIRAIRKRFKNSEIKVLLDVNFREVLDNCPYIDEVITCDLNGRDSGGGFLKLAGRLRSEDFDISIDLQNSRRSHLLAFLSGIPERYGYDNGKFSFLLNRKISLPSEPMFPVEHQGCVLGLLGITNMDHRLELWPRKDDDEWAVSFLKDNWLKEGQKLVAISLSASGRWKTKNWNMSSILKLTEMFAKKHGGRVVLLGTDADRPRAVEFMKKTDAKPIDAVGKTSISRLVSLVKNCHVLVAGDSAPMHIAAAIGIPCVALFGPTDPDRHLPPAEHQKVLYKNIKCSPCYKPTCSRDIKCMTSIKPEEVFDTLMEFISTGRTGKT